MTVASAPPPPGGRFWKSAPLGECVFLNAYTFRVVFRLGLSQRECIFHLEVPHELTYLEFTLPLYKMFLKSSTGGVWNSNGVAQSRDAVHQKIFASLNILFLDTTHRLLENCILAVENGF